METCFEERFKVFKGVFEFFGYLTEGVNLSGSGPIMVV